MLELTPNIYMQLASCTIACVGFAIWFNVKGVQIVYAGVGAFCTWLAYAAVYDVTPSNFLATFIGAMFVAFYAHWMARINKAPATIFLTVAAFPLIPGPNLYYMCYCMVMEQMDVAKSEAYVLLETCLGIALGFIVMEIGYQYANRLMNRNS